MNNQPTNSILWQFHNDYQQMPASYRHLFRSKLQDFYKNNGIRIETLSEKIQKLQEEFFVIISNQIQMNEPLTDKDGKPIGNTDPTPKLQSGKTMTDFQEKFKEIMIQPTTIT